MGSRRSGGATGRGRKVCMDSRSVGATGRGRRSAWAAEGRVVPLDEGGRPQVLRILVLKPLKLRSRENERDFL
jgi:hypothetical protein